MERFWVMNKIDDESGEILLCSAIASATWWGDEVTPKQFADDLYALGNIRHITVRINSPGGDVFAAISISGMLRDHAAEVTAQVDGLCASAATVIMVNCDKVRVSPESLIMIHDPTWIAQGTAEDMDKAAEVLRKAKDSIIDTYARRTGIDKDELAQMMADETWMNGVEAVEKRFADELVGESVQAAAHWSMKQVNNSIAASLLGAIRQSQPKLCTENNELERTLKAQIELLNLI